MMTHRIDYALMACSTVNTDCIIVHPCDDDADDADDADDVDASVQHECYAEISCVLKSVLCYACGSKPMLASP